MNTILTEQNVKSDILSISKMNKQKLLECKLLNENDEFEGTIKDNYFVMGFTDEEWNNVKDLDTKTFLKSRSIESFEDLRKKITELKIHGYVDKDNCNFLSLSFHIDVEIIFDIDISSSVVIYLEPINGEIVDEYDIEYNYSCYDMIEIKKLLSDKNFILLDSEENMNTDLLSWLNHIISHTDIITNIKNELKRKLPITSSTSYIPKEEK